AGPGEGPGVPRAGRVDAVEGAEARIPRLDGTRERAAWRTLRRPAGELADWLKREGDRELLRHELAERLRSLEPRNAGRPVARGQAVMARWKGGGWWAARVDATS